MEKHKLSDPITLRLPIPVLSAIEEIAQTCDRSRSWVMVRALRIYLAREGADILAAKQGRHQIANGDEHDFDDVLSELDAIARGDAA